MAMPMESSPPLFDVDESQAALFHALAEPTRLTLLQHLSTGEHRVRDLVDHLHLAQSTVSKHLACLRDCGLISLRSEGRASWFSLTDPGRLHSLLGLASAMLSGAGASPTVHEHLHDPRVGGGPAGTERTPDAGTMRDMGDPLDGDGAR
ncbi:ArsR/SmtB family transcription factor [Brachybacterium paraconglomeratum]